MTCVTWAPGFTLYDDGEDVHLLSACPGKAKDFFFPFHLLLWLQSDFSLLMGRRGDEEPQSWLCAEQSLKGAVCCWPNHLYMGYQRTLI